MVLDCGRIAEVGTHDQLLARGGIYHKLVSMQKDLSRMRDDPL